MKFQPSICVSFFLLLLCLFYELQVWHTQRRKLHCCNWYHHRPLINNFFF
jgi:hypothetical protein